MRAPTLWTMAAMALLSLSGCNSAESPPKVQQDVSKATDEAAQKDAQAAERLASADAAANKDVANAEAKADKRTTDAAKRSIAVHVCSARGNGSRSATLCSPRNC